IRHIYDLRIWIPTCHEHRSLPQVAGVPCHTWGIKELIGVRRASGAWGIVERPLGGPIRVRSVVYVVEGTVTGLDSRVGLTQCIPRDDLNPIHGSSAGVLRPCFRLIVELEYGTASVEIERWRIVWLSHVCRLRWSVGVGGVRC